MTSASLRINSIIDEVSADAGTSEFFDKHEYIFYANEHRKKINQLHNVPYYQPIDISGGFFGKLKTLFYKVIRRILRFLFLPIIEQQNDFNYSVTESINALYDNERKIQTLMDFIADENKKGDDRVNAYTNQILATQREYQEKIDTLEAEVKSLRNALGK